MPQRLVPFVLRKKQPKLALVDPSGPAPSKYPTGVSETSTTSKERSQGRRRRGFTSTTAPPSYFGTMTRRSSLIIGEQESFPGLSPSKSPWTTPSLQSSHPTPFTKISNR